MHHSHQNQLLLVNLAGSHSKPRSSWTWPRKSKNGYPAAIYTSPAIWATRLHNCSSPWNTNLQGCNAEAVLDHQLARCKHAGPDGPWRGRGSGSPLASISADQAAWRPAEPLYPIQVVPDKYAKPEKIQNRASSLCRAAGSQKVEEIVKQEVQPPYTCRASRTCEKHLETLGGIRCGQFVAICFLRMSRNLCRTWWPNPFGHCRSYHCTSEGFALSPCCSVLTWWIALVLLVVITGVCACSLSDKQVLTISLSACQLIRECLRISACLRMSGYCQAVHYQLIIFWAYVGVCFTISFSSQQLSSPCTCIPEYQLVSSCAHRLGYQLGSLCMQQYQLVTRGWHRE